MLQLKAEEIKSFLSNTIPLFYSIRYIEFIMWKSSFSHRTLLSRFSWCMYRDRPTKILCSIQNRNARKPCRPLWTESKYERQWLSQQSASASLPAPRTAIPPGVAVRHATAANGTDDGGDDDRGPPEGPREEVTSALQRGHRVIPQTKQEDDIPALLYHRGPQRTQVAGLRVNGYENAHCFCRLWHYIFLVIYIIMYSCV